MRVYNYVIPHSHLKKQNPGLTEGSLAATTLPTVTIIINTSFLVGDQNKGITALLFLLSPKTPERDLLLSVFMGL